MKKYNKIALIFFLVFITNQVNAQFWKKLKNKVEKKVEQKVEEKIDKETDKAIDSVLDGKKNKSKSNSSKMPTSYVFTSSLKVKISSEDGSSAEMEFHLGNYKDIYAMSLVSSELDETGKIYNVITPKTITMFMNVSGMKMRKTVVQDQFANVNFSDKVPKSPDNLKKTGATKNILGFTCNEYKYSNEKGYVSIWATKNFPISGTYITMLGIRENSPVEGFILEINSKSDNEKVKLEATQFNKNKRITIKTNEYKSMGF